MRERSKVSIYRHRKIDGLKFFFLNERKLSLILLEQQTLNSTHETISAKTSQLENRQFSFVLKIDFLVFSREASFGAKICSFYER